MSKLIFIVTILPKKTIKGSEEYALIKKRLLELIDALFLNRFRETKEISLLSNEKLFCRAVIVYLTLQREFIRSKTYSFYSRRNVIFECKNIVHQFIIRTYTAVMSATHTFFETIMTVLVNRPPVLALYRPIMRITEFSNAFLLLRRRSSSRQERRTFGLFDKVCGHVKILTGMWCKLWEATRFDSARLVTNWSSRASAILEKIESEVKAYEGAEVKVISGSLLTRAKHCPICRGATNPSVGRALRVWFHQF